MIRLLTLVACGYLVWTHPQARTFTANFLRGGADLLDQQTQKDFSLRDRINRLLGN